MQQQIVNFNLEFYERIYLILKFKNKNVWFSFMREPETDSHSGSHTCNDVNQFSVWESNENLVEN
jgi:hypothetical protein